LYYTGEKLGAGNMAGGSRWVHRLSPVCSIVGGGLLSGVLETLKNVLTDAFPGFDINIFSVTL
jgi:hypothetical protein